MNCKFCNAELDEQELICPVCGKDNTPAEEEEAVPATEGEAWEQTDGEEDIEDIGDEDVEDDEDDEDYEDDYEDEKPRRKTWKIVVAIACCAVLLLGAAAALLLYHNGAFAPKENDVHYKDSYIVSGDALLNAMDTVVITMGDRVLTNGELQVYYWMQVYNFVDNYGSSVSIDLTKPLSQQFMSDDTTWEQYFLNLAIATWKRYQVLCIEAEKAGYTLPEEVAAQMQTMAQGLNESAVGYGFANADEMIKSDMGPGCTVEIYLEYLNDYYLAIYYFNTIYEQIQPTREQVSAFFDENAESFASQYGVTKESGKLVDVRHILIEPKDAKKDANGYVMATDDQWEKCRKESQAILDGWKAGDATEESFAKLANEHSVDPGSNTKGGLYSGIPTGYVVENFDAWMFDESRQPGDTGLVKTEFGYHIMYYVGGDEAWYLYALEPTISDLCGKKLNEMTEGVEMNVDYKSIVLGQANLTTNMQ